ncbi:MAG TPA: GNAT family N-acetyltransferase [Aquihabitans sp.]|jgi:ribosomal-protein-alanine N-acetyltransferase|nr:GNAT family N-acetyltransferase [Aquihabitans sp.]
MAGPALRTDRLVLRRWEQADRTPFAELNADPAVMADLPRLLSRAESDDMVDRIEATFEARGFGLFAVEVASTGAFAGFTGLWPATFEAHFTPAVEVGWRLARWSWGNGYATEAARAALDDGFSRLGLDEVVSFTAAVNRRSQRVMEKLGMRRDPADDFDHPSLPPGHRLERHVLYRQRAADLTDDGPGRSRATERPV